MSQKGFHDHTAEAKEISPEMGQISCYEGSFDPSIAGNGFLHQLFESTAAKHPHRVAVIYNATATTYSQLNKQANQLANHIRSQGIVTGDYVGIMLPRTPDMYVAILAILKAGATYIPIDPAYPKERVHYILHDCHAKTLISTSTILDKIGPPSCGTVDLEIEKKIIDSNPSDNLPITKTRISPDSIAYTIYTSGTTGTPKGVKISHASACNLVRAEGSIFAIKSSDIVFQGFSIAFDASVEEIWLAFYSGAALLIGTEEILQAGAFITQALNDNGVTVMSTVPTLLSLLCEDVPTLRLLILGGEVFPDELLKRWAKPSRTIVNTYGPTEATVIATLSKCDPRQKITIGKPIPNYSAYILDENLQKLPAGKPGELCIGGLGLSDGYVNLPELTANKFIVPQFATNAHFPKRLYRTGDLCRINENGDIEFLGRIDSQIKLRGFRIELSEIESQLMLCRGVRTSAVAVKAGLNNIEQLVAYIVPSDSETFDPENARQQLKQRLAPFMVPTIFEIVTRLPMLPSGKVDRSQLPNPTFLTHDTTLEEKEEGSPTELLILKVWKKLFAPNQVNIHDNFFDLGGHSLFASQMISGLRKVPGMNMLSVRDIYTYPTIAELAAFVDSLAQNAKTAAEPKQTSHIRVSALTRHTVTLLQALSLVFFYGIATLLAIIPFIIKHFSAHISYGRLLFLCLDGIIISYPLLLLLSVGFKWLLIGRFKEGEHPLWGFYYFRFWLVKKCVDITPITLLTGTPFLAIYYRMMGAKIGKDVYLGSDRLRAFDLVSIGDHSSISKEAHTMGYTVEEGMLKLGKITIGRNCFVGARAMVHENATMEDDSFLLELSMLPEHNTIPKGEIWRGSPAQKCDQVEKIWLAAQSKPAMSVSFLRRTGLIVLQAIALLFILLFPTILLMPYSLAFYFLNAHWGIGIAALCVLPMSALYILTFSLVSAAIKWIILGRLKPGEISINSVLYIRKWIVDSLIALSLLMFKSLYATLYAPPWLRLIGAKIGKRAEISTVNHISTDLLQIGDESFLADSVNVGPPFVINGTMIFRMTHIGNRAFVGNSAVLPTGGKVEDGCLIGVLSITPTSSEEAKIKNASWLGSPPMFLPKRQESPKFDEKYTFKPTRYLFFLRGTIELFKITIPFALTSLLLLAFYNYTYLVFKSGNYERFLLEAPLVLILVSVSTMLFGWLFKKILIGRYKEDNKPLWNSFVWRNELVNSISENLVYPFIGNMLLGTVFAPIYFRLMGSEIGKNVFMETTEITEYDLVHIGDNTALNFGCTLQTHLFEDRVMKMSHVNIGNNCTIGSLSVILYDTQMHDGSFLQGLSLVMKGETLPENTKWQGSPCQLQN